MRIPLSADAEISIEADIDGNALHKLHGCDFAAGVDKIFTVEAKQPYEVQKRKHRKKRINKKWAKRYGYDIKFKDIRIERCTLNQLQNNTTDICGFVNS